MTVLAGGRSGEALVCLRAAVRSLAAEMMMSVADGVGILKLWGNQVTV